MGMSLCRYCNVKYEIFFSIIYTNGDKTCFPEKGYNPTDSYTWTAKDYYW